MNQLLKMMLLFFATISLAGCGNKVEEPQLKGIKIGELAPTGRRIQPQLLRTTNINAITFELPAENVKSLDEIWKILNTSAIRCIDPNGFAANGLRAGAGGFAAYNKVIELLKSANAKKVSTTALLLANGRSEVVNTGRLNSKTTVSYIYRQGIIKSAEVGPGILGLQVTARQISPAGSLTPDSGELGRVANVQVVPVISVSTEGLAPELAARLKANELRFYSAGFNMMMKAGVFLIVAPEEYKPDEITAAGRFFTWSKPKPAVRVLILVCTSVL